ncbi:MAG: Crp/Fnr family transcriptional regulator [Flavobacteriaceae bacterium]|nr:Crp/Fnr family transcriptional regulator [Flavobacteriaceae bacterium]
MQIPDYFTSLFEPELLEEIQQSGQLLSFKENDIVIDIGQKITHIPILISGALKVLREDENGDELLLYFLEKGETCAMSMTCCMGNSKSGIRATAETDGSLLLIPVAKMEKWLAQYAGWRNFVFETYNLRMAELLAAVDSLAFMNLEERLHQYLQTKKEISKNSEIKSTHQEIAAELHTSRVVISRLLKVLELKGIIKMHRNKISLLK